MATFQQSANLNRRSLTNRRSLANGRAGVAAAELAVCLPVLFLVIFGSIEACNAIFLRQALNEAAYEGAMVGLKRNSTSAQIQQRVEEILAARNVSGATIFAGEGSDPVEALNAGDRFRVIVSANVTGNVSGPRLFFGSSTLQSERVARRQ